MASTLAWKIVCVSKRRSDKAFTESAMNNPLFANFAGLNKLMSAVVLAACMITNGNAQHISEDTYCIRLQPPSANDYFQVASIDSMSALQRVEYTKQLRQRSELLSRFGEEPLADRNKDIFRVMISGAFLHIKDVQILKIEKRDKDVEVSIKVIRKLKDSTVLVHKKIYGPEKWNEFQTLASRLLVQQPLPKGVNHPVHDGSITLYEGNLSGRYCFMERHAIGITDPELQQIHHFLQNAIGSFFDVNCRTDTRQR